MKLELSVSSSNDCVDSPSLAVVIITPLLTQRIRHLSSAVKALDANSVNVWDGSPDWFTEEDTLDENTDTPTRNLARIECVLLNVTREDFYWTGIIKHTDVRCSTDSVPISRLDVLTIPP